VFVQELKRSSIKTPVQVTTDPGSHEPDSEIMMLGEDWRETYIDFIKDQKLPVGISEKSATAAHVMRQSKGIVLVGGSFYKRGARSDVLMKCVTSEDVYAILREIHDGSCANHAASKTLIRKAYKVGLYWPTTVADAEDLVRRCPNC
jgi:hypothetical protein